MVASTGLREMVTQLAEVTKSADCHVGPSGGGWVGLMAERIKPVVFELAAGATHGLSATEVAALN